MDSRGSLCTFVLVEYKNVHRSLHMHASDAHLNRSSLVVGQRVTNATHKREELVLT